MKKKNEVKKTDKEEKKDALVNYNYGDDLGAGFEDATQDDYAMPFLTIVQDLTPAYKDSTIEGIALGMFLNTASNQTFDGEKGIRGVPCFRKRMFLEWQPRAAGGGFVAEYEPDDPKVVQAKSDAVEFGKYKIGVNDLIETFTVYWELLDDNDNIIGQVVSSYKSMFIKKYKNFMTTANQIRILGKAAPLFAHVYRLKTIKEVKPGGAFYNWDIALDGPDAASCRLNPDSAVYQTARVLHQSAKEGRAKVDHEKEGAADSEKAEDQKAH